ncbi:MAG: Long-chain-fatty-acid--CoA ligase FadD15 [Deltaproteobacteria bacterium ADurb.BinA179]|jgi:long-chain acyl-CoA synthetase|nr:AMP-binding protein [Deltaproteobacteria bacterium]MDI9541784.1 AMP-binding protein [Pseudomonadota bacterium]OPZ29030.1 MAG: Long-chain-fatty-acid--CoA ligase FadD15 [Deltaproteobacteria bacterium ADurb.BinA179]HOD70219.1 AMP-binding protein [Deltaproteobacteria bacterium]HOE72522.1 AMP-binding protein [Deltaproteobacteria bacterium]
MEEFERPTDKVQTLPQALRVLASIQPDRVAMRMKDYGIWHDITWKEYAENVRQVAMGLHSLGVKRGEHVSIIGENKPEWLFSALGVMSLGGTFVGVYTTNPAAECEYVVGHSESVVYICEDEEQCDKALVFRERTPSLRKIVVWDMEGLKHFKDDMIMSFDDLKELGRKTDSENPGLFEKIVDEGREDETASIIYTSGTTGPPKGAMISHRNYRWIARQTEKITRTSIDDETISFLPLNHVYEQIFDLMMHLRVGHIVNFTENTDTVMNDLKDVSPTLFHAVPRIWEKYHSGIVLKMMDATWLKRTLYGLAFKIGTRYNDCKLAKKPVPLPLTIGYWLSYFSVFWKLKERLGFDRVRIGFSGAAPISHEVLKFFQSIGIPIREGYGLTETTGITHISDAVNFKLGTVGRSLPGSEVKIAEDGEILIRHGGIFKGYFKDDEHTKEAIDSDGWFHTGDVGEIDSDGYLKITDRKKDLIVTAGGKNVAPQYIENLLKFSPYINDAVVIGDRRKFISAIIVIDEENVVKWAQDHKVQYTTFASLTRTEEVNKLIGEEVAKVNKQLARVENIRKFRLLDKKLYTEDGEVTPTMKVKRKSINEQYKDLIESMYREGE